MSITQLGAYAQRNLDAVARRGTALAAEEPGLFAELQARVSELLGSSPTQILNAGCGHGDRYIPIADRRTVVGIDVEHDPSEPSHDIDERLVGDIETFDFGGRQFDVVYCWDVLEHLEHPDRALSNLTSALGPDGLLILGLPHARSIKGLITRFTPHWIHNWLWRRVLGSRRPAGGGAEPFPTVLSKAMSPRAIRDFASHHGLDIEFQAEYEAWPQKKLRTMLRLGERGFATITWFVHAVTLGRITASATDAMFLLRKRELS